MALYLKVRIAANHCIWRVSLAKSHGKKGRGTKGAELPDLRAAVAGRGRVCRSRTACQGKSAASPWPQTTGIRPAICWGHGSQGPADELG
eukprot:scaffold145437_cov33-Prasinocladus_malaysianus.AAC.2